MSARPRQPAAHSPMLPRLDEHQTVIAAGVEKVWAEVLIGLERAFDRPGAATYARLVGCVPPISSGPRPLAEGSTVPGFRVTAAVPRRELVLEGRHRFSTYSLRVHIEPVDVRSTLVRVESRAAFPGVSGRLYRMLVVSSRFHAVTVRRLLDAIRSGSENHATDAAGSTG